MDERVLNELIKQLTENLAKVESARQQVEDTVQAYDVLKTEVSKYTTELGFITQNVRTMIAQLEEIKERFLSNISTVIVDEIHNAVTTITSSIEGVSLIISSLETKVEQVKSALTTRADSIDTTLGTIRTELGAIDVKVASCSNQLGQLATLINSFKTDEKAHFDNLVNQLEEQENWLNAEFDVVRKHNKIYSIIIIVLLVIIIGLLVFSK